MAAAVYPRQGGLGTESNSLALPGPKASLTLRRSAQPRRKKNAPAPLSIITPQQKRQQLPSPPVSPASTQGGHVVVSRTELGSRNSLSRGDGMGGDPAYSSMDSANSAKRMRDLLLFRELETPASVRSPTGMVKLPTSTKSPAKVIEPLTPLSPLRPITPRNAITPEITKSPTTPVTLNHEADNESKGPQSKRSRKLKQSAALEDNDPLNPVSAKKIKEKRDEQRRQKKKQKREKREVKFDDNPPLEHEKPQTPAIDTASVSVKGSKKKAAAKENNHQADAEHSDSGYYSTTSQGSMLDSFQGRNIKISNGRVMYDAPKPPTQNWPVSQQVQSREAPLSQTQALVSQKPRSTYNWVEGVNQHSQDWRAPESFSSTMVQSQQPHMPIRNSDMVPYSPVGGNATMAPQGGGGFQMSYGRAQNHGNDYNYTPQQIPIQTQMANMISSNTASMAPPPPPKVNPGYNYNHRPQSIPIQPPVANAPQGGRTRVPVSHGAMNSTSTTSMAAPPPPQTGFSSAVRALAGATPVIGKQLVAPRITAPFANSRETMTSPNGVLLPVSGNKHSRDSNSIGIGAKGKRPRTGGRYELGPNIAYNKDGTLNLDIGRSISQRYQILGKLGDGTYATVVRARDAVTGKIVAIKVPKTDSTDPDHVAMQKEMIVSRIVSKNPHPNVVSLLDDMQTKNRLLGATEVMPTDLAKYAPQLKRQDLPRIAKDTLSGLDHLHKLKISHSDLKPANILYNPATKSLKIADLGAAQGKIPGNPDKDPFRSSPFTASPESWYVYANLPRPYKGYGKYKKERRGIEDVFSLGCMMMQLHSKTQAYQLKTHGVKSDSQPAVLAEWMLCQIYNLCSRFPNVSTAINTSTFQHFNLKTPDVINKAPRPYDHYCDGNKNFIAFLQQCLNPDPNERTTSRALKNSPFLNGW